MNNKKWAIKRLTVNLTSGEVEKLEQYCKITGRAATDVIRELIRSIPSDNSEVSERHKLVK
ncbi:CopG family transcriptional regulator [Nostoc sp. MG11]|uniref:CopG family transcriptional regulator n=1 Tax=Nostoc sp. MG11 TaxID=2721166 RepID=UPI0018673C84|nr:CopG family transcriptional regulator [Nostoc sp. MG11]